MDPFNPKQHMELLLDITECIKKANKHLLIQLQAYMLGHEVSYTGLNLITMFSSEISLKPYKEALY
jgi:hypothetical protein